MRLFIQSFDPSTLMEEDELIYKKLSGELTADEELIFEHRLAADHAFAEEYDFQRSAVEALAQSDVAMKEKLRRAYRAVQTRKQQRRVWSRAAAAVAGVLLLVGALVWYQRYAAVPLYEQYYLLYQPYPEVRGDGGEKQFALALAQYQRGQYAAAATAFQALPPGDERDLYLGNCYWQLDQVTTALPYFEKVQASDNSILRQHAEWYVVLGYLRQGQRKRVEALLTKILNEQGLYYKEAQQLQNELDN